MRRNVIELYLFQLCAYTLSAEYMRFLSSHRELLPNQA